MRMARRKSEVRFKDVLSRFHKMRSWEKVEETKG